jgi:LAGLIDADG endonuclease
MIAFFNKSIFKRYFIIRRSYDFFSYGCVIKYTQRSVCEFIVTSTHHLVHNIIPFFDKHFIVGLKYYNYLYFKSIFNILKNKKDLNLDG